MTDEQRNPGSDRLVVVRTYLNPTDAELAQGALEAAGIDSIVNADDAEGNQPPLWMGGVRLLVREQDAEEAGKVLGPLS